MVVMASWIRPTLLSIAIMTTSVELQLLWVTVPESAGVGDWAIEVHPFMRSAMAGTRIQQDNDC